MKALVTGGCGFIGSNMVDRLIDDGHSVKVIDNLSSEFHDQFYYNDEAEYHHYDISNYSMIENLFSGVDCVFHFAAESRIQPCVQRPAFALEVNTLGTCNVLQAAREHGVKRVMFSSSSSVYGLANMSLTGVCPPLKESMRTDCLNPYSVSKMSGEEMCRIYYELFGLETVSFRYFNVYGPREPVRGEYAPVVGKFLRQYREDEPMTIVGDGLQKRDFTHVSDVVNANYLASQIEDDRAYGQVFNVGAGTNYSILDLVEMIGGPSVHVPERPGEARETLSCTKKIGTVLGWKPTVNFAEYIRDQIAV